MAHIAFRPLRADEIECRVAMVKETGVSLLLYKDARCDQRILDETVGSTNWQKNYQLIDGQLFCTISIWDELKKQWIGKQDVGVESNTEAEKGRASDAQKRAGFAWGIGRELYTSPFIWISPQNCTIKTVGKDAKGKEKFACYDSFTVSDLVVEKEKIVAVTIVNNKTKTPVYAFDSRKTKQEKQETTQQRTEDEANQKMFDEGNCKIDEIKQKTLKDKIRKKGVNENSVLQSYKVTSFYEMTTTQFINAMELLDKYKDKY